MSRTPVGEIVRRAKLAGVSYPVPVDWDNAVLEAKLYPSSAPSGVPRPLPDWPLVHRELGPKGGDPGLAVAGVQGAPPGRLRFRGQEPIAAWSNSSYADQRCSQPLSVDAQALTACCRSGGGHCGDWRATARCPYRPVL